MHRMYCFQISCCQFLQNSYKKYEPNSFHFIILEMSNVDYEYAFKASGA